MKWPPQASEDFPVGTIQNFGNQSDFEDVSPVSLQAAANRDGHDDHGAVAAMVSAAWDPMASRYTQWRLVRHSDWLVVLAGLEHGAQQLLQSH